MRRHVEAALALRVLRVGKDVGLVEDDANVFAVWVLGWVAVVFDVAGCHGVDGVVAAHDAVFAGPPVRSALLVEDVARDDILIWNLLLDCKIANCSVNTTNLLFALLPTSWECLACSSSCTLPEP